VTQPADWGIRFQAITDAGRDLYGRSLRRYHELLDRVARGELRPEDVQRQFRDYLEEQAAPATRGMVELSVGLLAGLLHLEARHRDALLDGLLPPEAPAPPPPPPDDLDLTAWFRALSTYAAEQSARSLARHQRLVEAVAASRVTPADVQEQGRRFLEQQAPAFLGDVMSLGLQFVERLQQRSSALTDGLYDRVLGPDTEAAPSPGPPICVDLRGPSGSTATATIVVENSRDRPAEISSETSEFAPRQGGPRVRPALDVTPARFTLKPGERQEVDIRLQLTPTHFAVGQDYVATLVIAGAGSREQVVQLLARADAPEPQPAPKRRKARRKPPPASGTRKARPPRA
jgi:hypothetical protein